MRTDQVNPDARCPACLKSLDGVSDPLNERAPEGGDISICAYCALPLIFNTDLTVRALRVDERAALPKALQWQLELLQQVSRKVMGGRDA